MKYKKTMWAAMTALISGASWASVISVETDTDAFDAAPFSTQTPDYGTYEASAKSSRLHAQSFVLGSDLTVESILFGGEFLGNTGAAGFTLKFYEVADAGSYDLGTATQIGSDIVISATASPGAYVGDGVLRVDLDVAEQVALTAAQGSYVIAMQCDSTTTEWFKWDTDNSSKTDAYVDGYPILSGSPNTSLDFSVAMIPEPSTMSLIALVGGGLLFVRRLFSI